MRFHLLSVAVLIALGSCVASYSGLFSLRADQGASCTGPDCPCDCPSDVCTPCPMPIPPECLDGCGAPACPCPTSYNQTTRTAFGLSTINVFPTGPICSGFNIAPNMVMTVSNCILGKPMDSLYVSVNSITGPETLRVLDVMVVPGPHKEPFPCILLMEKPKKKLIIYEFEPEPNVDLITVEYHKWDVLNNGYVYKPIRSEASFFRNCTINGKPRMCVEAADSTTMGWNDIGTPFVEVVNKSFIPRGMYYGENLFQDDHTIVYLPLSDHLPFVLDMIEKNNK